LDSFGPRRRIFFINEILGEWHTHGKNYSDNAIIHTNAQIAVMEHHFDLWLKKFPDTQNKVKRGRGKVLTNAGRILQKGQIFHKAIKYSKKAIMLHPFQLKAWVVLVLSYIKISYK